MSSSPDVPILDRTTARLAMHPKKPMCHRSGQRFISSVPTRSPLTADGLRAALCVAVLYNPQPLMGRALSADRIQRLVLGIAELLQAECLDDARYDAEQIEAELHAVNRCLGKGLGDTHDDVSYSVGARDADEDDGDVEHGDIDDDGDLEIE